ncbi:Inorganic phosphate transporter pho84 [Linnemannia zychae]|nr:Inorganic phosphate transporter pho84 [Linnemannia zychae]
MIIIFGTLFCALSSARWSDVYGGGGSGAAVIQYLTFWRFVLAFGIGGDYPISATVPSEEAVTVRRRGGQFITILTSIQGLGNLMASLVTLMVLIRFRTLIVDDDAESMDMVWRICIAVGCLPALSTVLIRFTMPPSPPMSAARLNEDPQSRFNDDDDGIDVFPLDYNSAKEHGPNDATDITPSPPVQSSTTTPSRSPSRSPMPPQRQRRGHTTVFREYCSRWENLKVLIGTSLSWFLLDLAFRSISLNQSYLFDALGMTKPTDDNINQHDLDTSITNKTTLYHQLWVTTLGNLAVSLLGIVPGYWFAIFSIEKMGRKRTQFVGFAVVTLFFILLSTAFHQLKAIVPLFITTFTLSQFFSNLGRSTPFVIPGEVFPTRVRATAHGISAGSGKVGAILATLMFNRLVEMESPLSESFFTSSSSSSFSTFTATVVGTVSALAVIAFVFLIAAFIFPRGARRLLTSKLAWPRKASQGQRQH